MCNIRYFTPPPPFPHSPPYLPPAHAEAVNAQEISLDPTLIKPRK